VLPRRLCGQNRTGGRSGFGESGIDRAPDGLVWLVGENGFQEMYGPSHIKTLSGDCDTESPQIILQVFVMACGREYTRCWEVMQCLSKISRCFSEFYMSVR
jgi:hypothetical protein